jgi:DNA (cytosine-5)-methyltransferase 1
MSNLLKALKLIIDNPIIQVKNYYTGRNRANSVGEALESYVKDIFANSFDLSEIERMEKLNEVFSYLGNQNKQPKFFLVENVSGMLLATHGNALENIKGMFRECGYNLSFQLLNVSDYGVPQDRKRVFFVGYRTDLGIEFEFPIPTTLENKIPLSKAIGDLKDSVLPAQKGNITNGEDCLISNHEYMTGGFSTIYMSRNRVRSWDEVSFTIQAGGRHAPCHPQAPKFQFVEQNLRIFVPGKEDLYRRLSVRECARVQTFPDHFKFFYKNIADAYKMIGNAVPVRMANVLAKRILEDLQKVDFKNQSKTPKWHIVSNMIESTPAIAV